ncbi:molybdenum cofactor guanylyltransferase [Nocardioides panaciterrulae]|uniref:Molybdopterin-guanine dinucleotide biosynthesis protein A n=1 Tax=Nocardioides panaciterrulae TaxID=661492 RepID=A0A7Y9JCU8_9ACTN|nr:NTP transferase domain-containing protein [Nocardioides panaciterrulae]NYD43823.1 molybdopterin-guanine dinucleotide biosynthesis protein A [Nocardioides panaciterrulae]
MDPLLGPTGFAAVVLAGGTAARLDGADKSSIEHGGRTLLEWSLDALLDAEEVVVVGDPRPTGRPVTFTRENPRYGGPVAALLTGYDALVRPPRTLGVLAVDMPRVTAHTFRRLHAAAEGRDGAFLVDHEGRRQLAGVLDAARLDDVRPGLEAQHGMSVRRLLEGLDLALVAPVGEECRDVDTWADVRDLQGS